MAEAAIPAQLARRLLDEVRSHREEAARFRSPVAIVGMACRFPGGPDPGSFWRYLEAGGDAVTLGRPGESGVENPMWGAYLPGMDLFDPEFFRIAPVEAELMDPQQRLLLEVAWEALEDAGFDPRGLAGSRTGVYAGIMASDYRDVVAPSAGDALRGFHFATGNSSATAIGRVAFTLGLEGPAIAVDTACSSSLVTMHQAAAGLQRGEADLALAGGVNAVLNPLATQMFLDGGALAPDGRCKTFDAAADGYVRGEGCGMLVLKRLADAERDGDRILGVLRGSAVNHDGASAGLTVPNGSAQERVIAEALERAGIEPATVDYLEAHGTGTELGDPIELRAAAAGYGSGRDPERPLLIGSVKTNVGHLEPAAGVAGVIKVLLAMRHRRIPRHLHFERPNPRVDWDRLPLRVTAEATAWPEVPDRPMRAAVSSFSISGTNAHVVLEGFPPPATAPAVAVAAVSAPAAGAPRARETRILPLSARSREALSELAGRYLAWMEADAGDLSAERLADMAWVAGVGRSHFEYRAATVFGAAGELRAGLSALAADSPVSRPSPGKTAFLFTGQGSQWAGMGRALYETEPAARASLDRSEAAFRAERGESLLAAMFGSGSGRDLDATEVTQPALYALAGALTALWESVGVRPDIVLGHSVGEIAAAGAAGVFDLEDGMRFAARRGALMGSLPAGGAMTAVFAAADRVVRFVAEANRAGDGPGLDIAAENGAHQVVSGPLEALALVEARFRAEGVRTERLRTSHAFHSPLMDPALPALAAGLADLAVATPSVPLVSNVTGRIVRPEEALDGEYWRLHARAPVAFAAGVRALADFGVGVVIEVGPRAVLGPAAALAWPEGIAPPVVIPSLGPGSRFVEAVGRAYETGLPVSFAGLFAGERRRRISLPTYPFQRRRFWGETPAGRRPAPGVRPDRANGEAAVDETADLLYELEWRESAGGVAPAAAEFLPGPERVARAVSTAGARIAEEDARELEELERGLEDLARSFALSALETLGWQRRAGSRVEVEPLRRELGVVPEHRGLLGRMLTLLAGDGVLLTEAGGSGWRVAADAGALGAPEALADGLLARCPSGSVEVGLLRRSGGALAEVLRGRADARELLFGGEPSAADLYRDSPGSRAVNRTMADAVAAAVARLPEGRRLRVLEVGAGTGGTTEAVLGALPAGRTDYAYTDISAGFFAAAEDRFGGPEAGLSYRVLDIERDPGEQGFGLYGFDLVLAANVLHATRDLGETLSHCRRLLAPSGMLVLLEALEARGFLDLTFGLLPGWWRFADGYRTDNPLLGPSRWRRALADAGYGEAAVLRGDGGERGGSVGVLLAAGPPEVDPDPGLWVVWPAESALGGALSRELERRGQRVRLAPEAEGWSREGWRELLAAVPAGELRGVVHLGAAAGPGPDGDAAGLRDGVERLGRSALALTQGLEDAEVSSGAGLWFVTRGAQSAGGERGGGLSGSVLWGFGRTARQELAGSPVRLVDLDPDLNPDGASGEDAAEAGELALELLYPGGESEVARRGGRRWTPRLVRREPPPPDGSPAESGEALDRVRGDRSYLVTGGLGGIGLRVAGWLAERGAGAVVLNGRRAPDAAAAAEIGRLRAGGTEVRVEVCDVTDAGALGGLVSGIGPESGLPPLGGVIHGAGVLSDGSLANQDWSSFERVWWPKVLGAWHLHRATRDLDLDLFVLFSSFTGLSGNPGQANHAAANTFLDRLAVHRRALGLPGQAIQWGAWSGVGEAEEARERIAGRLAAAGVGWMTPEQGLMALERVVRDDSGSTAVASFDWAVLGAASERLPALFGELVEGGGTPSPAEGGDLLARLRETPAAARERFLVEFVQEEVRAVLRLAAAPPPETGFFELGMDSVMATELRNRLNRAGAVELPHTVAFDYPNAARLAAFLAGALGEAPEPLAPGAGLAPPVEEEPIAVVGMACRFPGGRGPGEFWTQLAVGGDAVRRGRPDGLMPPVPGAEAGPWGGYVPDLDRFDAEFFRITPVEAELMDPQQRLLLEVSWEALEDAGLDASRLRGSRGGVFAGISTSDYREFLPVRVGGGSGAAAESLYLPSGNSPSTATGRIAFTLGLEGPAIAVDTACSSSLVAIHQAAAALQRGEADLALAGGVNAILAATATASLDEAGMLSPDGRCKTFDAAADGYVRGEGCGMVVLKRLSDAERDGDRIAGVILGSAVNQDGASAGLTVPNGLSQARVIREAVGRAGIEASSVDYLEAHGTGTELGDPIEVQAAAAAYGENRDADRPLLLGSVKTNVGHLEAAAGVAGVVKVLLAMREGMIPKHLHFAEPNPRIEWDALPVRVVSEAIPWPAVSGRGVRAGVSSFGFSGTNAHLVLESYEAAGGAPPAVPELRETHLGERPQRLLPLSARGAPALSALAARYLNWLEAENPDWERLSDAAWTAGVGRSHFDCRAGIVFRNPGELRDRLALAAEAEPAPSRPGKVAFLYTGQESQWVGMGRELYAGEPVFREALDRLEPVFHEERGESLLAVMFGDVKPAGGLDGSEWAQPALYALSYGLTELWASVGVRPAAVLGHGVGELAAALAAGAFSPEDGLRFAARRGSLMGSQPAGGGMTAVFAAAERVEELVEEANRADLAVAADNGAHQVVSGPVEALAALEERLDAAGVRSERLRTRHAFHGALLDPVLPEVEDAAAALGAVAPRIPLVSNVTGRALGPEDVPDGSYWRRQARAPVRFAEGLGALVELGVGVLVEVGPRPVLGPLALVRWPEAEAEPAVVSSPHGQHGWPESVGDAYEAGLPVSFEGLFAGERRRRVGLPTYPFQRRRYWVRTPRRQSPGPSHPLLGVRSELGSGEVVFENEISSAAPAWLSDHRLFGRVVVPGAFYGGQAAGALAAPRAGSAVEEVRFERPLVLSAEESRGDWSRRVQFVLGPDEGDSGRRWEVYSRTAEGRAWVRHAAGRVRESGAGEDGGLGAEGLETLKAALSPWDVAAAYRTGAAAGTDHGPAFRGVRAAWAGPGEALGEVALPDGVSGGGLMAHPALLDACFQVLGPASGFEEPGDGDAVWLPAGWDRLWLRAALPDRVFCHARIVDDGEDRQGGSVLRADLAFYRADGNRLGGCAGFELRRASRPALLSGSRRVADLLYEVRWRESGAAPGSDGGAAGTWLLAASGAAESAGVLAGVLRERGETVVVEDGGDSGPRDRDSWRSVMGRLPGRLAGVVHLGGMEGPGADATADGLREGLERAGSGALSLVQGLNDAGVSPGGLWFATRGGQVVGGAGGGEVSGAALWGFGRTVAQELPGLGVRLVDLDPGEEDWADRLAGELLAADGETQVAWRGGRRRLARLARLGSGVEPAADQESGVGRVRSDRSYLVTGGLGGLGLAVAAWLGERGAGAVVLSGRRAPRVEARAAVDRLRRDGLEVRVELCDVTEGGSVERLVSGIGAAGGLPPLGGVIHGVGVVADGSVAYLGWEDFGRVWWPKVLGAWRLHRATLRAELDLFVLFSSTAGVFGNPGQSNYAAANAYLDQLALHRRSLGLPGQSVAWGPWSGAGMAEEARERLAGRFSQAGVDWIAPERALDALDRVLRLDAGASVVVAADWPAVAREGRPLAPFLDELVSREAGGARGAGDLAFRLREAAPGERQGLLERFLQEELQSLLRLAEPPPSEVGFFELGMDSLTAVDFRNRLNRALLGEVVLANTAVLDHPNVRRLGRHLMVELGDLPAPAPDRAPEIRPPEAPLREEPVAVVGMACRFPGGRDPAEFWTQLAAGGDAVRRGRPDGLMPPVPGAEAGPWGAYVPDLDRFDAEFFRITPVEAELVDPQQRLLLEVSWEALEDAGVAASGLRESRTGVYAGIMGADYRELLPAPDGDPSRSFYMSTGNTFSTAIGRVAFFLGLNGPAIAVDTACSSSLVAIHQAAAGLARREVDLALAGGVNALLVGEMTRVMEDAGMLSPDGRCKTFSAAADGYVRGEGCGVVVLKRLSDAQRDGDRIWGLVLGSAVNQDGASAGLTVPNGPAQEAVIREALARAGVAAETVDYLEAHGTGTELGDPIEVRAAASAFGEGRPADRPLLMGSVKTNVGHLEAAAGVAAVVKVLLAMRHGEIPKHLHFAEPNPRVAWDALPVRVVSESVPWPEVSGRGVRAGVSSFSLSGTNAHLVLEGYGEPGQEAGPPQLIPTGAPASGRPGSPGGGRPPQAGEVPLAERGQRVLPLSARSGAALSALAARYLDWLEAEERDGERLTDAAWTAGAGRSHFGVRAGVVFRGVAELREQLAALASGGAIRTAASAGKVAFLYTGQGSQWAGMGRELYEREPVARRVLDRLEEVFREERGASLLPVMFGEEKGLERTEWTQPALFALGAALTELWESVGVAPEAVLGHGVGEVVAAWASGAVGLEDGFRFAARRGALMGSLPPGGGMAAVFAPLESVESELRKTNARVKGVGLSLAAENGTHVVVSGPRRLVRALCGRLLNRGVRAEVLRTSHGFHSGLMDPVLGDLEREAGAVGWSTPGAALVSNVTGRAVGAGELGGAYWRRQARSRVRFAAGMDTLAGLGVGVVIEIGPRAVLGPLASLGWPGSESGAGPAVVPGPERGFAEAVAAAYEAGLAVSFAGLYSGERRRRVPLPTYPFQRQRHWVRRRRGAPAGRNPAQPLLGVRHDLANGEVVFETELREGTPGWLSDHRVFGRVVAPGALFASWAVEAVRAPGTPGVAPGPVRVAGLRIEQPLFLAQGDEGRVVQFLLGAGESPGARRWEVFSRADGEDRWIRHASGEVGRDDSGNGTEPPAELERLRASLSPVEIGELYRGLASSGVAYGPAFRGLTALWSGGRESLGEAALPAAVRDKGAGLPPVLLDACFHTLWAMRDLGEGLSGAALLPVGWERLRLAGTLPERVWCHARLGRDGAVPGAVERRVDLELYGPDGEWVGSVSGLALRRASRAALLRASDEIGDLLYEVEWRESAGEVAAGPSEVEADPGLWVVWPAESALGGALSRELERRGQRVRLAPEAEGWSREGWRELLAAVPAGELRGVVHLGAAAGPGPDGDAAGLRDGVERLGRSALALTQGLEDAEVSSGAGLWFVTRGAQSAGGERGGGLSGSVLWGFGRTARQELAGSPVRLVDLDPDLNPDGASGEDAAEAGELALELLYPGGESEVARRGGRRWTPRLVRREPPPPDGSPAESGEALDRVRGDRSYLVTGGLGGIGLRVAGWLAERGAGAVVLNGRRAPDAAAAAEIGRLRAGGTEVRVEVCDVTDAGALGGLVSGIGPESGLPPLGGVIHGAGVLSDGSLANQDWSSFERVWWPKVLGAWHLHRATRDLDLDLFVLFSSFTGLSGNPGQANHAAANTFLDRLAVHRRALGLPGQAIQWGAWSGVGEAEEARERIAGRLAAAGVGWMTPEQGLMALERVVRDDSGSTAVASFDWAVLGAASERLPALFGDLVEGGRAAAPAGDLLARLRETPAAEREQFLVEYVRGEAGATLRLPAPPPPDEGFFDVGMDSLTAVEFRNRLNRAFSGEFVVPNTAVFDHPTAAQLARHLGERLALPADSEPVAPPEEPLPAERQLSVDAFARILAEMDDEDD